MRIRVSAASKRFAQLPEDLQINIRDTVFERIAQKETSDTSRYTADQLTLRAA